MNRIMETEADVVEMLELQLSEVEMLECMFPNPGEFEMDDPAAVSEIREFIDKKLDYDLLSCRIGFTIKLNIDENDKVILQYEFHNIYNLHLKTITCQGLGRANDGMGHFCVDFNKFLIFHNGTFSHISIQISSKSMGHFQK